MEQTININGKIFLVKEVKYKDFLNLQGLPQEQIGKKMIQLSTGLSDEEYDSLGLKDGIALMQYVNEINGLNQNAENFHKK